MVKPYRLSESGCDINKMLQQSMPGLRRTGLLDDAAQVALLSFEPNLSKSVFKVAPGSGPAQHNCRLDLAQLQLSVLPKLPAKLQEIHVTGNCLRDLASLQQAPRLCELYAAVNRLTSLAGLQAVSHLLHAGLAWNQLRSLGCLVPASLVSLDLAFNWLEDLRGTLAGLQQLPQLRYLRLQGNPFCLVEGYQAAVQQGLPQLQLLDGSELQRAAEQAAPAALQGAPSDAAVGGEAVRPLRGAAAVQVVVQLSGLSVDRDVVPIALYGEEASTPDASSGRTPPSTAGRPLSPSMSSRPKSPTGKVKATEPAQAAGSGRTTDSLARGASNAAMLRADLARKPSHAAALVAAQAAAEAVQPAPPPVQYSYTVQVQVHDGRVISSFPVTALPVEAQRAAAAQELPPVPEPKVSKVPAAKKTGKVEAEAPTPVSARPKGSLKVVLEAAADVQLRDWLLGGVHLSVLRTARQLPAAGAPGTAAGLEAGAVAQPSAVRQTVVADALFAADALVDGVTRNLQACVKLMSRMPLFTASGRRTSWQEALANSEQVGSVQCSLQIRAGSRT